MHSFFLYILFLLLPLTHTKIIDTVGWSLGLSVNGNFEFTKIVFFQIIMGLILASFIGRKALKKQPITLPKSTFLIVGVTSCIFLLSTIFSFSPLISFFGNGDKSHSFLVFMNLLGLFIVLANTEKPILKNILYISIVSLFLVCIMALKEYFFPTFNYGNLSTRAIGTFGHPNYLSLFIILFFPFIIRKKKYICIFLLSIITLLFTKSLLGITLGGMYIAYYFGKKYTLHKSKYFFHTLVVVVICIGILIQNIFGVEKLHSFLSRFYVWDTTLQVVASNPKIFLFGGGFETLDIYFNSFKSPYLYIFENFGFTADRPHNIFLNIFYHIGFLGLCLFFYLLFLFGKHIRHSKVGKYEEVFVVFLIFCFFNYPSIAVYCIGVLFISLSFSKKSSTESISVKAYITGLMFFSIIGMIGAIQMYRAEIYAYNSNYEQAITHFPLPNYFYELGEIDTAKKYDPLPSSTYYTSQIQQFSEIPPNCKSLVQEYPSVENFFYCGRILEKIGKKELSLQFYHTGLDKLPDLWNKKSPYWGNYFVKNTITGNRFFSKKFSDLKNILIKTGAISTIE